MVAMIQLLIRYVKALVVVFWDHWSCRQLGIYSLLLSICARRFAIIIKLILYDVAALRGVPSDARPPKTALRAMRILRPHSAPAPLRYQNNRHYARRCIVKKLFSGITCLFQLERN